MVSVNPLSHDASIIPNPYILQTNPESEMYPDTLAIVDVETTGQSAVYGRIIEIAIIRVEKGRVTARFESLVNPECYISPVIFGITGISNEDVSSAPSFQKLRARYSDSLTVLCSWRTMHALITASSKANLLRSGCPSTHAVCAP